MKHVDAQSRNPVGVMLVSMCQEDWFLTVQFQDDKAQSIVIALTQGTDDLGLKADYKVWNGQLCRRTLADDRLYVPIIARFNLPR